MSRDRYAVAALDLLATIDADVEAVGLVMAEYGLTAEEAAAAFQRLFDAMPRMEDASIPNVAPEPRCLQGE